MHNLLKRRLAGVYAGGYGAGVILRPECRKIISFAGLRMTVCNFAATQDAAEAATELRRRVDPRACWGLSAHL